NRSAVSFAHRNDGASMTLLFGESFGGTRLGDPDDTSFSWMGSGAAISCFGLRELPELYDFSSAHVGGVQFCFGDGSVRTLQRGIDVANVFIPISGYRDGVMVTWEQLEN